MKYKFFRNAAVLLLLTFSFHSIASAYPVPIGIFAPAAGHGGKGPYIIYDMRHSPLLPFHPAQPIASPMMNGATSAFAKSILTTVTSAGLDSIGNLYMDARYPTSAQTVPEAAGARGPPTGLAGLLESVKNLGRSLQGLASTALKDAGGTIRSFFIGGNATDTASGKITNDNGSFYYTPLTYGSQPLSYENVIANGPRIQYGLDQVEGDYYRSFTDQGGITDIRFDPARTQVLSQKTVGNLSQSSIGGWLGDFNQARYDFLDGVSQGIDSGIDGWIGSPSDMPAWAYEFSYTALHTAGDIANGMFVDPFNLGRDMPAIGNSLSRMMQTGEWKDALGNYFTTGRPFSDNTPNLNQAALLGLNELGRAAALVPMIGGAMKGVGAISEGLVGLGRGGFARIFGEALPNELKTLAEANIKNTGKTVLGHSVDPMYGSYLDKAQRMDASHFSIEPKIWNKLTSAEKWATNQRFLDIISDQGDRVYFSTPKTAMRPQSDLVHEVQYLLEKKGYRWINQWSLRK